MRKLACALACALALACNTKTSPPVQAEGPKVSTPPRANEIRLEAAAWKEAGIAFEPVREKTLSQTIRASGRITLNDLMTWRAGAVIEGRVVRVEVNLGDAVRQGQILARLHSHDTHESRAAYRRALSEISRLKTQLEHLGRMRERARRLYELKAGSLEQVEQAEAGYKNGQAAIEQTQIEANRARIHLVEFLGVSAEEPAGESHAEVDLIPVPSPAAGTLIERKVTSGSVVPAAGEMFVISDLSSLWMLAAFSEEHYSSLRVGAPVRVRVHAHPGRVFVGRITRLGEQLDPATRTVQARIELANRDGALKPEMFADAEMDVAGTRKAVFVPEFSVQEVKGYATVFVHKGGGVFEARPVGHGPVRGGMVEITRGLSPGEQVVTRGAFVLKSQMLKSSLEQE